LYSEAGLSNLEVLKTATGNAAKAWDIPVGRLGVGSKANMVLLNGNPLENLEVLKDINTIWKATLAED
ncbi:MAG: amidohydrolase family protein, partial [Balneolaceae bacterium]|nr:amidohydrolase family protein [Balneolaceae bacterium]